LHDIVAGFPEYFADLIEEAWVEWWYETRQHPRGWAYAENLLNHLYREEVERGPNHRILPLPPEVEHPMETWMREN
jgi:hypothetical protein